MYRVKDVYSAPGPIVDAIDFMYGLYMHILSTYKLMEYMTYM